MAIDPDEVIEDAINSPKSATNAAGETVESRSADEILKLVNATKKKTRRQFAITRGIPPGATGDRCSE